MAAEPAIPGMVWISGGEFDMGAVVNGQGSGGLGQSHAEPCQRVLGAR